MTAEFSLLAMCQCLSICQLSLKAISKSRLKQISTFNHVDNFRVPLLHTFNHLYKYFTEPEPSKLFQNPLTLNPW